MTIANVKYKTKTNVSSRIRSEVSIDKEEVYDPLQRNKFVSLISLHLVEN